MDRRAELPLSFAAAPPRWSQRLSSYLGRDWKIAALFVTPLVVLMFGLIFWPFVNAILMSFTTRNAITRQDEYRGFYNYDQLFNHDSDFKAAVDNTVLFTFASVGVKFVVGLAVALLLNSKIPYRSILTGLMLLPWIVPEVVTALAWRSIYDPIFGGLNPILMSLGIIKEPVAWLGANPPGLAMASVIAVNVWKGIPFYTILLLSGLKGIDREQLEAAAVDGASIIKRFRHVTLPGLRHVIIVTLLLSFISTFNTFGLIFQMTGGGPGGATRVYSVLAYERAVMGLRFGPGAAVALSMAPVMIVLIFILARFMRPEQTAGQTAKKSRFDGVATQLGYVLGMLLDIILLPFELIADALGWIWMRIAPRSAREKPRIRLEQRERIGTSARMIALLPMLIFVLFPFYWIFVTSFKTDLQIQRFTSIFWPSPWTAEQYSSLLAETGFVTWFKNTLIVATTSTAISVTLAALAAYALARLKFLGGNLLTTLLLITYLLPGSLLFIPLYRILTQLGIIDTYGALIATYPTFLMPFATWVLIGYFRSIPVELEEAALIDGASRLTAFRRVTLPLAMPALLSVTLFAFTTAWNEFLFAYVFITKESLRTLPAGLQLLNFGDIYPWGQLMAASLLMAIPVVAVYIFAQRFLVEGLTAGSIKG